MLLTAWSLTMLFTAGSLTMLLIARSLTMLLTAVSLTMLLTARPLTMLLTARPLNMLLTARSLTMLLTARSLSQSPHVAGTAEDDLTAEWIADEWRQQGLTDVRAVAYDVLLSYPLPEAPNMVGIKNRILHKNKRQKLKFSKIINSK